MTHGSLFTGIDGFGVACQRAGIATAWACEIDPQCRSVLRNHYGESLTIVKDVHDVRAAELVRPDIITAGWPCQGNSVAGRRAGMADQRSGLWGQVKRILAEFRPAWFLGENVPGILSVNGGRDWLAVLRDMAELGYGFAYRVLDAQWFGVAQRRRRVFLVGHLGDWRRAAEILFESESLPWDSPPSRAARERVAASLTRGTDSGGKGGYAGRRREDDVNLAVRADGFASEDGTGRGTPLVFDERNITSKGNRSQVEAGRECHTLHESPPTVAYPLDMRQLSRGDKDTNNRDDGGPPGVGIGADGDPSPTVAESHPPAVCYSVCLGSDPIHARELAMPQTTRNGDPGVVAFQTRIGRNGRGQPKDIADALTSADGGTHADSKPHVTVPTGVRRLTPRECERLQGFPDDWTRYGDGKEVSDSARYRMLGNAVAVPNVAWIAERIAHA